MGKAFDFRGFEQDALCMTDAEFMPDGALGRSVRHR